MIPGRCGERLTIETVERLSKRKIAAIKESTGSLERLKSHSGRNCAAFRR
jgi:dihydrodipicolinate synthase/N-acetylneuraminate lyase